jgi:hypothetical protein
LQEDAAMFLVSVFVVLLLLDLGVFLGMRRLERGDKHLGACQPLIREVAAD